MIQKTINEKAENTLNGTTALNTIALMKGANILRVHDVKEAKEAIQLYNTVFHSAIK
jgi:dihydropteroate synthase